jgi:hypothetical protein
VTHGRRAELVGNTVRAQPGGVRASQIVRRAARDTGAGAGALQRLAKLGPRQEEPTLAALGVLEREIEQLALPARHDRHFAPAGRALGTADLDEKAIGGERMITFVQCMPGRLGNS